ncbi:MAG: hypothetical protein PHV23_03320 [Candidatus Gracilibacteria bacterium]|nr:hypothetical protein [Candidatus Gracilibacteria bacterium]
MKQKVIIFIIYGLVFFVIGIISSYLFLSKSLVNNTNVTTTITGSELTDGEEDTEIVDENTFGTGISLKKALLKNGNFSENINLIAEKFNFAELLVNEFSKVKSEKSFDLYLDKFGAQDIVSVFGKLKNKEGLYKYYNLLFDKYNVPNEDKEYYFGIIDTFILNGTYSGTYLYNGTPDSSVIPLLNLSLDEKLKICKDSFSTVEADLVSCNKYSIILSSDKENNYCEKLENNDKRLCEDILSLIK